MGGQFFSTGKTSVGNKGCCLEVTSATGGGLYKYIHGIEKKNGGCPQGMSNVHHLVGPFVDRPHIGVGMYMGTHRNFLSFQRGRTAQGF